MWWHFISLINTDVAQVHKWLKFFLIKDKDLLIRHSLYMATHDLGMQRARALAAMILNLFSYNIPVSAPEG